MSDTTTAVLVGLGAVGLCGLAMWGLDRASSRAAAFGLAPAYHGKLVDDEGEDDEPKTQTDTERMALSWSGVQTIRDPKSLSDLLWESNPPTTIRQRA